jgi:cell wall-associated NlpC family hydrolase
MIATWAGDYVGIPFKTGGSDRRGCDCWGLLGLVYREVFGITVPLYDDQYDSLNVHVLARVVAENLPDSRWRPVPTATPGDGLLMRVLGQEVHVGIAVGDRRFLHAAVGLDESCIERLDSPKWARRQLGTYRYV